MYKTLKRALVAMSMIPLLFAFGITNASMIPNQTEKAKIEQAIDSTVTLAKGQNQLPSTSMNRDNDCV